MEELKLIVELLLLVIGGFIMVLLMLAYNLKK